MLNFFIWQSLAVFCHIWSTCLPSSSLAALMVTYHIFFLLRFSLVFLMYPTHSSLPNVMCCHIYAIIQTTDFINREDSPLCIFMYWPIYSSNCFQFKGSNGHFLLLRQCPSCTCIAQDISCYNFIYS